MPELPEVVVYLEALEPRIAGHTLERVRLRSASLLRTWDPPLTAVEGRRVAGLRRLGKRIVLEFDDALFLVIHLMIAGRLRWKGKGAPVLKRGAHAAFDFDDGTLLLTEAASHKRASLHVVRGEAALGDLDPGGAEPLDIGIDAFRDAITRESHTLKRALTDPRILSGIGNAYSDEILHAARLSPFKRTGDLDPDELRRLFECTRECLEAATERLRRETGDEFPEKVTAFHPDMGVHGRFGKPCPVCGTAIQRIVHGEHETNYCSACQTGGRLLRDRALSRLLRVDWPATVDELENRQ
jgi:formamidopyrimidine-DNA glycosylase